MKEEEIQTSRLINATCSREPNGTVTFQAQTFIFASNISCQLHVGRSNFLSFPLSPNLLSSNPIWSFLSLSSFISSHLLLFPSLHSPSLTPCISSLLFFFLSTPPFTISPVSSGTALEMRAVSEQIHFLPPWSQNQPNQTPSNSS